MQHEIIPWKCHLCRVEFSTIQGGICASCKQPTCLSCLEEEGLLSLKAQKQLRCRACAEAEKKSGG